VTAIAPEAVLLLVVFGVYASRGDGGVSEKRRAMEQKREHLLDELVALEKKQGSDKKRDELKEKLAQLYRDLDQIS
jgi:hypothetical protein